MVYSLYQILLTNCIFSLTPLTLIFFNVIACHIIYYIVGKNNYKNVYFVSKYVL